MIRIILSELKFNHNLFFNIYLMSYIFVHISILYFYLLHHINPIQIKGEF